MQVSQNRLVACDAASRHQYRRADAVKLGPQNVKGGYLTYTQQKNRIRKPVTLTILVHSDLRRVIDATPMVGVKNPGHELRQAIHAGGIRQLDARAVRWGSAARMLLARAAQSNHAALGGSWRIDKADGLDARGRSRRLAYNRG